MAKNLAALQAVIPGAAVGEKYLIYVESATSLPSWKIADTGAIVGTDVTLKGIGYLWARLMGTWH